MVKKTCSNQVKRVRESVREGKKCDRNKIFKSLFIKLCYWFLITIETGANDRVWGSAEIIH